MDGDLIGLQEAKVTGSLSRLHSLPTSSYSLVSPWAFAREQQTLLGAAVQLFGYVNVTLCFVFFLAK